MKIWFWFTFLFAFMCANGPGEIVTDLLNERDELLAKEAALFGAIAHGDEVHRAWLKEAIAAHFAGLPVPPPRALSPSPNQEKPE